MRVFEATPTGMVQADRPECVPGRDEILMSVETIALNRGESRRAAQNGFEAGLVPGWDTAGRVVALGTNVTGPALGTRVVARGLSGGWAEKRVVHREDLAIVPDSVSLSDAASLATAGTTALGALTRHGSVLGRRVLITAATGSVGRLAIQIAKLGGAEVIAQARSAPVDALQALGASQVVEHLSEVKQSVDIVLDSLGGPVLAEAARMLRRGGHLQCFGWGLGAPAVIEDFGNLMQTGGILQGFAIGEHRVGTLLEQLLPLVESGALSCGVTDQRDWSELPDAAADVIRDGYRGKTVLTL